MIDPIIRFGALKLGLSLLLALLAWSAQRLWNRPQITHTLWLVVLLAMLTPMLFKIEISNAPAFATSALADMNDVLAIAGNTDAAKRGMGIPFPSPDNLVVVWGIGSIFMLALSVVRIQRFNSALAAASKPASEHLQYVAAQIGATLGLRSVPAIRVTNAKVSPLVWCLWSRPRVVIPAELTVQLSSDELRWMIAHELAHIRRRDHIVRWVEWAGCIVFWWNPVTWLARRNLRVSEEMCCDALALAASGANPRGYAKSLLTVVDFLSVPPALLPPGLAITAASPGRSTNLERRIRMIVSGKSISRMSRRGRAAGWALVACLLSLGLLGFGTTNAQTLPTDVRTKLDEKSQVKEKPQPQPKAQTDVYADVDKRATAKAPWIPPKAQTKAAPKAEVKSQWKVEQSCAELIARTRAALAAGEISEDEAKVRISKCATELKATKAEQDTRKTGDVEEEIRKAIEAGLITPEQGEQKLAAYRARAVEILAKQTEELAQTKEKLRQKRTVDKTGGGMTALDCEKITRSIAEAIAAGLITLEQGQEKMPAACRR